MKQLIQLALVMACLTASAFGAWTETNDQSAGNGSSSNTISAPPFTNSLTNPSVIVATCRFGGGLTATVMDTAGNIYADSGIGPKQAIGGPGNNLQVFIAANNHTTASNVVTCNFSDEAGVEGIEATEFTGGSAILDGTGSFVSTAGSPPCGSDSFIFPSFTTSGDGDLIYAVMLNDSPFLSGFSAGTSPLSFTGLPQSAFLAEYAIQATHGSTVSTFGCTTPSTVWGGITIAFGVGSSPARGRAQIIGKNDVQPQRSYNRIMTGE